VLAASAEAAAVMVVTAVMVAMAAAMVDIAANYLKTIENSLVQYAQGYFIHIFICCDNLLMYRERIKKKKTISIIPKKVSTISNSFSNEKENMLCKNLTANNV
jgi:hypothetical protein